MTLADVIAWFLLAAGSVVSLVAAWLCAHALGPALVASCGDEYARPVRATLVGLATSLPTFAIGAAAAERGGQVPPLGVTGVALLLFLLVAAVVGAAGLAWRIGGGLAAPIDEPEPWRRLLRGGLVLAASFLLPFGGWFLLLPWALVSGFGALLLSGRRRRVVS